MRLTFKLITSVGFTKFNLLSTVSLFKYTTTLKIKSQSYSANLPELILIPGPIVVDNVTLLKYLPLAAAGFALIIA